MQEPENLRVISYMDVQWFFRAAKFAYGFPLPNSNPLKLTNALAAENKWEVVRSRAYIDVPSPDESEFWHNLWRIRINDFDNAGIATTHFIQRNYMAVAVDQNRSQSNANNNQQGKTLPKVCVRSEHDVFATMAMEMVSDFLQGNMDVIVIFSNERKYGVIVDYLRFLARKQDRYLKIVSAYPYTYEAHGKQAGIDRTDWLRIDGEVMRTCTDFVKKPTTTKNQQLLDRGYADVQVPSTLEDDERDSDRDRDLDQDSLPDQGRDDSNSGY